MVQRGTVKPLSRRGFLAIGAAALCAPTTSLGALRVPYGGALRVPLPAPRAVLDPMRATELADVWPLGLTHAGLAVALPEGAWSYPLLESPPRAEGDAWVLRLRPGLATTNETPVDAAAVLRCWSAARSTPAGRLALALLAPMDPLRARGPLEILVRGASAAGLDEFLGAPALAVTTPAAGGARAGLGAFAPVNGDANTLRRNALSPLGGAFLERVELAAPQPRNDELRAFATSALDASWWGTGLYEVSRAAARVTAAPAAVVGVTPTPGGPFASAAVARALEVALAPLSADDGPLRPFAVAPPRPAGTAALTAALASRPGPLRLGRPPADAMLGALAERAVALLDAVRAPVMLVSPEDAPDATLRAVAPMGADPWLGLASFLAASASAGGDEAAASAIARTPAAQRALVAAPMWGRGVTAVLGRLVPVIHLRAGVRGARFEGARLMLGDASVGATPPTAR